MNQNELLNKLLPDRRKVELETLYNMWAGALSYFICVLGGFGGYCRNLSMLPIPDDVELDIPDIVVIEIDDDASIEFAILPKADIRVMVCFNGIGSLSSVISSTEPIHEVYHRDTLVGYVAIPLLDVVRTMYSTSPWLHRVVNTTLRRHFYLLNDELKNMEGLSDDAFFKRSKEISDEIYTTSAALTESIGKEWPGVEKP